MNRIRKTIAALCALALSTAFFSSCKKVNEQEPENPTPSSGPVYAKHISTVDQYGLTGEIKEEGAFSCAVYYPRLENTAMDTVIEEKVMGMVNAAKEGVDASKEGEKPQAELSMDFRSVQVGTNGNLASLRLFGWLRKTGEEHPSYFTASLNFEIASSRLLGDGDLFIDGYQEKLKELSTAKLAETYPDQKFSLPEGALDGIAQKALLTSDGVELHFASSEISEADLGFLSITLPYDSLGEVMSEELKYRFSENYGKAPEHNDQLVQSGGRTIDPTKPMIALSFDDGPDSKVTPQLLDLLAKHNARATFCVVGNRVEKNADIVKRAVDEGHEIANHTFDHKNTNKLNAAEIKDQILRTNEVVKKVSGFDIHYIRPTYGNVSENLKQVSRELNMPMVNWTIDSEDWDSKNPDMIYQRIMSEAKDGRVILCHDIYGTTYQAMERVVPDLVAQGYQVVTIAELFSFADSAPTGGQLWRKK